MSFFSAGSMTISVFTTIQVFAWLATIWKGRPVATASMYFAVGSVVMLVIGGLSGVFTGVIPVDWQAHNTYYVVAPHPLRTDRLECLSRLCRVLLLAAKDDGPHDERDALAS